MSRRRTVSTKKKLALLVTAAAVAGGGAFALATTSNASQSTAQNAKTLSAANSTVCQGLSTALGNNQKFIDGQRAAPDAQSAARIANREAVIAQIKVQQKASGCAVGESAQGSQTTQPAQSAPAGAGTATKTATPPATPPASNAGGGAAAAGSQVCNGSTVTLSGEAGAPAASSNQFPAGTTLKVTNLDNNKSTTVKVTSVSGSCVLLNNAAFEQVREPGKFLIRRALIQKVG
jgi:rare lipoprotein A (peptidoglycan hydrolase)